MRKFGAFWLASAIAIAPLPAAASGLDQAELSIVRQINTFGAPTLDVPMRVLSDNYFLLGAPLALSVVAAPTSFELPVTVLTAELLALGSVGVLKYIVRRPRPYETDPSLRTPAGTLPYDPYSFPSGHAAVSFAAATVIVHARPDYAWPAYGLAALISYSRIYNGVHYPTDILTGAVLGYGVGKATIWGADQVQARYGWPAASFQLAPAADFVLGVGHWAF
ncbi:undecaprenyl pyrophosphate phosphatase [compost metagenome]